MLQYRAGIDAGQMNQRHGDASGSGLDKVLQPFQDTARKNGTQSPLGQFRARPPSVVARALPSATSVVPWIRSSRRRNAGRPRSMTTRELRRWRSLRSARVVRRGSEIEIPSSEPGSSPTTIQMCSTTPVGFGSACHSPVPKARASDCPAPTYSPGLLW